MRSMVQDCALGRWLAEAALTRHWCDVTLQASGREYRAHRVVLSCASPFIRRLLLSRPNEDVPTTIVLADFSSETVEALLQYVYSGEVRLAPDHLGGFIALATALQIHIDKKHLDGLRDSYQELMKNSSRKKYELISTDFLVTADAISDNSVTKDNFTNCEAGDNECQTKCLSLAKEMDYCDIKSESCQKNMDVEVLIKSDKIAKSSAIILPQIRDSVEQKQSCDEITFQNYRNCFLKNILVSKGKLFGRNGAYDDIKLAKEREMQLFDDSHLSREGSYKSVQAFTDHENHFKNNLRNMQNNQHEDNYSNSSCEILDESNEEKYGTKSEQLFHSNYPVHAKNYHEGHGDLNYISNNFTVSSTIGTGNSPPLDLVNNQRIIFKKLPSNVSGHLFATCKAPWNGMGSGKSPCNRLNQGPSPRNDKLVRPIPSLMPIQGIQSGADFRKVRELHNESPAILDLTTVKSVNLVRNSKSAFDEVNYKWTGALNDPGSLSISRDCLSRSQTNYLHNQKSLRLGFSVTERGDCCASDNSVNFTRKSVRSADTLMSCSNPSEVFKPRKVILHNKVLASPWSGRCPVYYRREERRKESIDFQLNIQNPNYNPTSICYAPESTVKPTDSDETSSGLSIQRYQADRSNDSNNNSSISNTNVQETKFNEFNETESNHEHTSETLHQSIESRSTRIHRPNKKVKTVQPRKGGDFELTKILNGTKPDTAMPPAKSPDGLSYISPISNESFLSDELILTAVKVESTIFSEDVCALKCEVCLKMFTSRATLALHASTHEARARYKCEQCDKCFSQLRNYKYHVSVHKGTKEFAATCNVCGKYFNDRGYLSSHMKIHRNRKEYQCPHCPKSFNQRVAYNMHVRIHTGVKPHQCEACGKAFSRKMLLKQHARTHSGEKPYSCAACGKRFADRSNMTLHMRLHSGVKPFSCTLCPKSFTKKHHLKTHLNYHTGNKPYSCCKCGLTFSQSSNMRTHMKKCVAPDPGEKLLAIGQETDIGRISASP